MSVLINEFEAFINEPPAYEDDFRVRDYRHELYPKWSLVLKEIQSLQSQLEASQQEVARLREALIKERAIYLVMSQDAAEYSKERRIKFINSYERINRVLIATPQEESE
jgi:5-bromo-4-chloroindolyl phosphate hydrolysis protein